MRRCDSVAMPRPMGRFPWTSGVNEKKALATLLNTSLGGVLRSPAAWKGSCGSTPRGSKWKGEDSGRLAVLPLWRIGTLPELVPQERHVARWLGKEPMMRQYQPLHEQCGGTSVPGISIVGNSQPARAPPTAGKIHTWRSVPNPTHTRWYHEMICKCEGEPDSQSRQELVASPRPSFVTPAWMKVNPTGQPRGLCSPCPRHLAEARGRTRRMDWVLEMEGKPCSHRIVDLGDHIHYKSPTGGAGGGERRTVG